MSAIRLLVSVRDAAEARAAIAGGADIIDVKEPARGPLGMADHATIAAVVAAVDGRCPVSAALGELIDEMGSAAATFATHLPAPLTPPGGLPLRQNAATTFATHLPPGVDYAKCGLAGAPPDWAERLAARFGALGVPSTQNGRDAVRGPLNNPAFKPTDAAYSRLPWDSSRPREVIQSPLRPIAAAYADHRRAKSPPVGAVLAWAVMYHAAGLLIDTFAKDASTLLDWLDADALRTTIAQAHAAGLLVALAGSLRGDPLRHAAALGPDIIAVRGAACAGHDRQGTIDQSRVRALVSELRAGVVGSAAGLAPRGPGHNHRGPSARSCATRGPGPARGKPRG